jgi:hypothetical protein
MAKDGGAKRCGIRCFGVALGFAVLVSFAATASAASLDLVGQNDLGGGGLNGQIATIGNTVIVASGILPARSFHVSFYDGTYTCPTTTVKVVDVSTPSTPTVVAQIPVAPGLVASDVAALHVSTPFFTGDLLAVSLARCSTTAPPGGVAYYSITDPSQPVMLGFYQPDTNRPAADSGCGGFPTGSGPYLCPSMDHVVLVQRPDGTVLSLSTEPGASSAQSEVPDPTFLHGDLRIVDVTNPAAPNEVGSYPNAYPVEQRPPGYNGENSLWSNNGCRPFNGAEGVAVSADGSKAYLPFYDGGLLTVDLTNPAAPTTIGRYQYPTDRNIEGNAAYADMATVGGRTLALVGEQDWIAPDSSVRIDGSSSEAGSKFACEAMFSLFDPTNTAPVYRHPGSQVAGGIVYVGLGQPGTPYPAGVSVQGMIAFRDKNIVSSRQFGGTVGSTATAVKRLQDDGAIGVIVGGTSTTAPQAISADGNPAGITIPTFSIDTADATALRDYLCPAPATPPTTLGVVCGPGGQPLTGAMVDNPGSWGALRVLDVSDPSVPTQRGIYQPPPSLVWPPPDLGVYSVHNAVASGSIGYVAAHAGGVRVVDLTSANPTEIASFVPSDMADPTMEIPSKADVTGVGIAANGSVVVSDVNSGLYVLALHNMVTCLNVTAAASGGSPKSIQLSCTDTGKNPLAYSVVAGPTHGTLGTVGATGQVIYTSHAGYSGPDSFTYRATTSDGTSNTATVSISVTSAPLVSHLRITNKVFAVARGSTPVLASAAKATKHKRGTAFAFILSEPATVKLAIAQLFPGRVTGKGKRTRCVTPTHKLHRARRCTIVSHRGTLTRRSHSGANRVAFSGRIGTKALKPGSYRVTVTATSHAGLASRAQSISFRIVRR